mmetsp:Transcript_136711/g.437324  ORF Transcript_136711/g.437324 Transcript_136711/m.437324 type:complete len:218 (-) Transcript_136711:84-737(-)
MALRFSEGRRIDLTGHFAAARALAVEMAGALVVFINLALTDGHLCARGARGDGGGGAPPRGGRPGWPPPRLRRLRTCKTCTTCERSRVCLRSLRRGGPQRAVLVGRRVHCRCVRGGPPIERGLRHLGAESSPQATFVVCDDALLVMHAAPGPSRVRARGVTSGSSPCGVNTRWWAAFVRRSRGFHVFIMRSFGMAQSPLAVRRSRRSHVFTIAVSLD